MTARTREGSHEIAAVINEAPGMLALGWQLLSTTEGKVIWHFVSLVLKYFGGRKFEAKVHLDVMLDLNRQNLDSILAMNRQHLASREASDAVWRESALRTVDRLAPHAAQAVAPVGRRRPWDLGSARPT